VLTEVQDRDGYIAFHDRLGDTYRAKGHNISTAEVEQALSSHPAVESANVYAIDMKQFGYEGQLGCAAVTMGDERAIGGLEKYLVKAGLPAYAVPRFMRVIVDAGEEIGRADTVGNEYVSLMLKKLKTGLRKEGFSPAGRDRMYWIAREGAGYSLLSTDEAREIQLGKVKL
jgi:acyl-CoA synthetase (AMP-forming)/AMP-acid ligase II